MPAVTSFTPAKQPAIPSLPSARANDPCRYWKLWDHPEDIDSIIACLMWRDKHRLRAMDIAAALAFVQPADYWGINAEDVINVYGYLQNYQDIPENPYSDWQSMRDMRTHPHWRYYVTWASSCNIQRMQKSLDASLLPVHEQLETSNGLLGFKLRPFLPKSYKYKLTDSLVWFSCQNTRTVFKIPIVHSIHSNVDICGKWPGPWAQEDFIDSLICCEMFPERHSMDEDSIAADTSRQTPDSIDRASDLCRKWSLWGRGDHLDSIICCKMFPARHALEDSDIATVLGMLHRQCAHMTGQDVAELYHFLETHPDLHTNGIRLWQGIKNRVSKRRNKADDIKVTLAIGRFSKPIAMSKL